MGASEFALSALAFVLTYAIHSTLLLGVVCLVAPRLVRSLALREKLWKTAMFGGLLTALVQVGASMETPLFHWTLASQEAPGGLAAVSGLELAPTPAPEAAPEQFRASRPVSEITAPRAEQRCAAESPIETEPADAPRADEATPTPAALAWLAPAGELASRVSTALGAQLIPSLARGDSQRTPHVELADEPAFEAASVEPSEPASDLAANDGGASWSAALANRWREWTVHGLALWALFALAVLVVFASMCWRLVRCMRGRTELESGPLREVLDRLVLQAFPAGRRIRLYVAPELRAPVSMGWLRPAICVPPRALVELSSDEQESMLAHELAHLVRRDSLWLSAAWLVERVFFFQPLHRVARAELHDLAELACDEWAARRTGDRLALASCLARIAEWIVGAPRALPATSMAEQHGRCRLAQRIERLLDDESSLAREDGARRWLAPAVATGLGALVFVAPGVSAPAAEASSAVADSDAAEASESVAEDSISGDARLDAALDGPSAAWPAPASSWTPDVWAGASSPAEFYGAQPPAAVDTAPAAPPAAPAPALGERASLDAELARLNESLAALRDELAPLRVEALELGDTSELACTLASVARRVDNLERRSRALREVIQVLENLESKPAHPSSTPFGFQGSRSLP